MIFVRKSLLWRVLKVKNELLYIFFILWTTSDIKSSILNFRLNLILVNGEFNLDCR